MEKDGTEDGRAGPVVRNLRDRPPAKARPAGARVTASDPVQTAKRRKVEAAGAAAPATRPPSLPVLEHWGLDPLFWTHVKLFIGDVLSVPSFPGFVGTFPAFPHPSPSTSCGRWLNALWIAEPFNLHGHPIVRVAIMGVIVEALPRPNRLSLMGTP